MKKVIIFGASDTGRRIYHEIEHKYEIVAFVDENCKLHGERLHGIEVVSPMQMGQFTYDYIILAVLSGYERIREMLISTGTEEEKIITQYVDLPNRARENFVSNLQKMFEQKGTEGAVAELGVYQGEFSKVIGAHFRTNRFYLFDTFEGFPERDARHDQESFMSPAQTGYFSNTSAEAVLEKICNPDRCVVRKGYFPDTADGILDKFIFVNLDADLYLPTKEGLSFFFERLQPGGILLVHDYFSTVYTGVKKAVDDFCDRTGAAALPIGDTLSIAIIKKEESEV